MILSKSNMTIERRASCDSNIILYNVRFYILKLNQNWLSTNLEFLRLNEAFTPACI